MRGVAVRLLFEALLRVARARAPWCPAGGRRCRSRGSSAALVSRKGLPCSAVLRFAGELERLQLGGDGEGEEAEHDPAGGGDPDPFEDPLAARARPRQRPPDRPRGSRSPGRLRRVAAQVAEAPGHRACAAARRCPAGPGRPCSRAARRALLAVLGAVVGHERARNHADARGRMPPAMSPPRRYGVDLGGTKMLIGVLDSDSEVIWESREASTGQTEEQLVELLVREIEEAREARPGSPRSASASRRRSTTTAASRSPPSTCRSTTCRSASWSASGPGCRSSSTTTPTSPPSPSTSTARRGGPTTR